MFEKELVCLGLGVQIFSKPCQKVIEPIRVFLF